MVKATDSGVKDVSLSLNSYPHFRLGVVHFGDHSYVRFFRFQVLNSYLMHVLENGN